MKELKPILEEHITDDNIFYDAFCGGANVICKIKARQKVAVDDDRYIIALWRHIQRHGIDDLPKELTKEEYYDIKKSELDKDGRYPDWLIGYVSTACSYGSKVWGGYANFNPNKNENHIREAWNGLKKQVDAFEDLKGTFFDCNTYRGISCIAGDVIYCDPPYAETVGYRTSFNHNKFWEWCREKARKGCYVYISEYDAPSDFKCIWESKKKDGMGTTKKGIKQNVKTEKLFVYNGTN